MAGIVGFVFGSILGPIAVNFVDFNLFDKTRIQNENRVEAVKSLVADIEKIKVIAPSNSIFRDCLSTKVGGTLDDNYETCYAELRQKQEESRSILKRNLSAIQLFFDTESGKEISDVINEMDYLLYEMENNQYISQSWTDRGCPDQVSIVQFEKGKTEKDVPRDSNGEVKCALAQQTRADFNESIEKDGVCEDCISALKERNVSDEYVDSLIIPGDDMGFREYMLSKNSTLYSVFLANAEYLLQILQDKII
jgi:hypothetical protein